MGKKGIKINERMEGKWPGREKIEKTWGKNKRLCYGRDRATRLSVKIWQLQNIPIMWHYLHDPAFSRFYTIPECDRHQT